MTAQLSAAQIRSDGEPDGVVCAEANSAGLKLLELEKW
jgi:hypothetical protein